MPQLESLAARVRGEYAEMPGLRLTLGQACRLWQMEPSPCERLLEQLVRERFLYKTNTGCYIALPSVAGRQAKAQLSQASPKGIWLFTRGAESVRLRREEGSKVCRLFVYGPRTDGATHEFADIAQCMKGQAAIERDLLAAGYQLAGPSSERRANGAISPGLDHRRAVS
jgi:hypothetical protein